MKISVERLKQIIQEEVDAHVLQETLTDKEEKKKAKLEDELDDLEHKWMKEGKLSSAYAERYGLNESQNHGKVIWHTLTESGKMELYDMKFGDTIIANIPATEIKPTLFEEHGGEESHGPRTAKDSSRKKARKKARTRKKAWCTR